MTVRMWCAGKGGGWGKVGGETFAQVCVKNNSGAPFIVPIQGPIPSLSLAPIPVGEWEGELHRSCGSMTVRTQLKSVCWPNHVCVKWVTWVYSPLVYSNSIVRLEPSSRAYHPLRGKMEKNVSIACRRAHHAYTYFTYLNNPRYYPLSCTCNYPHHHLQIWRRWWCQYGFFIIPGWERHLLYPSLSSPDAPPPLIYYNPGGWWVFCIRSYRLSIFEKVTGARHELCYELQWRGLCCCS